MVKDLLLKLNADGSLDLSNHPKIQARIQAVQISSDLFTGSAALAEFQARFHSEEACADYLFAHKWPNGFICSRCSHTAAFRITTRRLPLFQCAQCHYQASPIVGTIMESSSTDLRKWFTALFIVSSTDSSINALRLSAFIQVTYKTAWLMLRKIRQSITQADAAVKLTGAVSLDIARCGKPLTHTVYSEPDEFPVLIGKAATRLDQPDYVKIQMVSASHYDDCRVLRKGITAFRDKHIESGAAVTSSTFGIGAKPDIMPGDPFVKQARDWMQRTFLGLRKQHLQHYWNEFTWRLNTKFRKLPLFESMLKLCAATPTTRYADLLQQN
jgi:hypothetical protein